MRLLVECRAVVPLRAVVLPGTALLLAVLAACTTSGSQSPVASTTSKPPTKPTASPTYNPLAGPVESAAQLPKSCDKMLSDTDLTAAFGSPQVGDSTYGSYAPLPKIGRTGRVTCGFDISIDQFGHPGPAGVTVSVITYNTATNAVSRVANDVNDTEAKGATGQPILVNGHPATILYEPAATAASPTPAATASAPTSSAPAAPSNPSPNASASASAAGSGGLTELLMADGNRTFVITIPMSKLSGNAAANTLANVMALVYQHTLPPAAAPSPTTPASASPSAPKPTASKPATSPKPSAT